MIFMGKIIICVKCGGEEESKGGPQKYCKKCLRIISNERSNIWNKKNRDRMNEVAKRYYDKNKLFWKNDEKFKRRRREYEKKWKKDTIKGKLKRLKDVSRRLKMMKKIKETFTLEEWKDKLKLTEGICPKCQNMVGISKLTLDHILPISLAPKGFEYTIDDIQPLCKPCNSSKRNKYDYSRGDLHHVGILVKDFDKSTRLFQGYGGKVIWRGIAKKYEAECIFIDMGNMLIELIKTTKKGNHLSRFLGKYGEGFHHIALARKFDDGEEGALPDMKVKFLNPKDTGNTLIEFVNFDDKN